MEDMKLEISIERPTAADPYGYIGMVARNAKPMPGETHLRCVDAADGTCSPETLEKVIRDLWSYYRTGKKSFAQRIDRSGGGRTR
jgi:hypothetical protein